jgi:hydroxyethylthiazole kinase-like uncharacterized protein yjeF
MSPQPPMDAPDFSDLAMANLRDWPLPALDDGADKEERGSVLIVAGSRENPGAALLGATAAARAGAGKLLLAAPQSVAPGIALAMPEARVIGLKENADGQVAVAAVRQLAAFKGSIDALLIGPGLAAGPAMVNFAARLLRHFEGIPAVLDAAAMDLVLQQKRFEQPVLLTPHGGEMAHLTGHAKEALASTAAATAAHYARQWHALVALKGATTWIAAPEGLWRHAGGHAGLATSGSGDVLAGLVTGLAARGATLVQACAWGVVIHSEAGKRLAQRIGPLGYLARELLPEIPVVLAQVRDGVGPGGPIKTATAD